jgi:hypothetical protein
MKSRASAVIPWDADRSAEMQEIEYELAKLRMEADSVLKEAQSLCRHGDEGARRFRLEMRVSELRAQARELNSRWCDLAEKRSSRRRRRA